MWVIYVGALTGILVLFWASRSTKADANADAPVFVRIFFPAGSMALHLFPKTDKGERKGKMAAGKSASSGGYGNTVPLGNAGTHADIYGGKGEHLSVYCDRRSLFSRRFLPFCTFG